MENTPEYTRAWGRSVSSLYKLRNRVCEATVTVAKKRPMQKLMASSKNTRPDSSGSTSSIFSSRDFVSMELFEPPIFSNFEFHKIQ